MSSHELRASRRATLRLSLLLGSASLFAIASSDAARAAAQPVAAAAPAEEEILITGSLIRGAPAVGVPVTAVGEEEFEKVGAVTISEMLANVPAIAGNVSVNTVEVSGANRQRFQNAEIHGIGGQSTATLLMINGRRHPGQGTNLENVDPSIIPSLAVERVDVLAAGASATYGSDAVAGVINVVMKRGFNGAITQLRATVSTDLGWDSARYNAAQLYGTTWDTLGAFGPGGLTVSYEWWDQKAVPGTKDHAGREYLTTDFEPFGYDDRTPLGSSYPGVVSFGNSNANANPSTTLTVPSGGSVAIGPQRSDKYCTNCLLIPVGTGWDFGAQAPGETVSWATLVANPMAPGKNNFRSPYEFATMNPHGSANYATLTFDQQISENMFGLGPVGLFVDAYYMNRRYDTTYPGGYSPSVRTITPANGTTVPTNNPYRPSGVPAGTVVRSHYSLMKEFPSYSTEGSISQGYAFGLNFDELPYDWHGKAYFSTTEEYSWSFMRNLVNPNAFDAAVGNTIASTAASGSTPAHSAYSKPANIPYLNTFCDALVYQCNSPQTLEFIRAFRDDDSNFNDRQFGLNFDGPIFDFPFLGGPILGAVGFEKLSQHFYLRSYRNENTFHPEITTNSRQYNKQLNWAVFGQVNIPVITDRNALPFVKGLLFELGYRYDDYYYAGNKVKTPKLAANWDVGSGLTLRGAVGSSFNTPGFGLITNYEGIRERHGMVNKGFLAGNLVLDCPAHTLLGNAAGAAVPGSLQAKLNPNCLGAVGRPADPGAGTDQSITRPVGFDLGPSLFFLRGEALGPETADQWSLGFNFAPRPDDPYTGILFGLSVDVSWWNIQREGLINTINAGEGVNDPSSFDYAQTTLANGDPYTSRYIAIPRPDLPLTAPENATFKQIIDDLIGSGKAEYDPNSVPFVKFLTYSSTFNTQGFEQYSGIDFSLAYDWDMGAFGSMGASVSGDYRLRHRTQNAIGSPIIDDYTQTIRGTDTVEGQNSGHQLQRARFNLRWTDADATWNVNLGSTWIPHTFNGGIPPACFWRDDYGPGTTWAQARGYAGCYPGSPFYPQPALKAQGANDVDITEQEFAGVLQPSQMFFDLAIAYSTGDMPTNAYLQNLRITLNVNNILNRLPSAIDYDGRTASGSQRIREGNPLQRTVGLTITKTF